MRSVVSAGHPQDVVGRFWGAWGASSVSASRRAAAGRRAAPDVRRRRVRVMRPIRPATRPEFLRWKQWRWGAWGAWGALVRGLA